ncbi:MAG: NAD-dependent DNA ligase LigA [bacterium]|nr:NAD-dependent DNA ligase LigA [bacterium]
MVKQEAKKRLDKLKGLINKYRHSRLVLDKTIADEQVEDSLKKELFDIEQEFPDLVTSDSPSQRVGGEPLREFKKVKHPERMLSFNDVFNNKDITDWENRLKRIDPRATEGGFYCELKLDGLAIELIYENGVLKTGATRGNGTVGEDVTHNLKTIEAIPLSLPVTSPDAFGSGSRQNRRDYQLPVTLVVRGEVFINKKDFEKINKSQDKANNKIYANPRNLAAGSIRQLDPKLTAERHLDSFAYSLLTDLGQTKHEDEHEILKKIGFRTNTHNKFCKNLEEVQKFRDYWEKHREKLPYEIDGVVVIVNDNRIFKKLGIVGKAPRGAVAYKFSPRRSTTTIKDIIIGVGRTGTLTPVAVLEPVEIGGTMVSRATLHNEDEIKRLGIKIGDTVVVERAGDVIPDIKQVLTELRTGKEKSFHFPTKCPSCNEPVKRLEGEVAYKCVNKNCPAIKREGMYHFISRSAMDMDGIGPKIIDQLMDSGLIKDSADLYGLTKEDLLNLERFAEKSADNAISAIQSKKTVSLDRFIYALGIPHVGSETAVDLARKFGTLEKLSKTDKEELEAIKDIGATVAESIYDWFNNGYNQNLIKKLNSAGIKILKQESSQKSSKLKGMTFVFTGTLETIAREQGEEMVREHGGDTSSSVSKETSYVVAGENAGSKLDKANKLGVKIIDEKEFLKIVS